MFENIINNLKAISTNFERFNITMAVMIIYLLYVLISDPLLINLKDKNKAVRYILMYDTKRIKVCEQSSKLELVS